MRRLLARCLYTRFLVLCEPAQSKCTWTCHQSHLAQEFTGNAAPQKFVAHFVRACAFEMHMDMSQERFYAKNYRKNAAQNRDTRLCEPAQSKCSWTCHKSQILRRNLQGKCRTLIPGHGAPVLCEPAQSKCTWTCHKSHVVQKLIRKMPKAPETTSNEHWARTLTVRTPSVATLFGEK